MCFTRFKHDFFIFTTMKNNFYSILWWYILMCCLSFWSLKGSSPYYEKIKISSFLLHWRKTVIWDYNEFWNETIPLICCLFKISLILCVSITDAIQYASISIVASNFNAQEPNYLIQVMLLFLWHHQISGCPSLWIPCPSANPRAPGTSASNSDRLNEKKKNETGRKKFTASPALGEVWRDSVQTISPSEYLTRLR